MKAIKMVDELISFYFKIGITDIQIDLQYKEGEIEISLKGHCLHPPREELEMLTEVLNAPRQEELEEYYWELVGESDHYQELTLLGSLVDYAEIDYHKNQLTIKVCRKR